MDPCNGHPEGLTGLPLDSIPPLAVIDLSTLARNRTPDCIEVIDSRGENWLTLMPIACGARTCCAQYLV